MTDYRRGKKKREIKGDSLFFVLSNNCAKRRRCWEWGWRVRINTSESNMLCLRCLLANWVTVSLGEKVKGWRFNFGSHWHIDDIWGTRLDEIPPSKRLLEIILDALKIYMQKYYLASLLHNQDSTLIKPDVLYNSQFILKAYWMCFRISILEG